MLKLLLLVFIDPGRIVDFGVALESLLSSIDLDRTTVILAGDFNVNLTDSDLENRVHLSSTLFSLYFKPTITKPTRFPPGTSDSLPTTIDHIWTNSTYKFKSGIFYYDVTDHMPCFYLCELPTQLNTTEDTTETIKIETRPYHDSNYLNLLTEISSLNWDNILDYTNVDLSLTTFINHLNYMYRKFFPLKIKYISLKRLNKPWITTIVKHSY